MSTIVEKYVIGAVPKLQFYPYNGFVDTPKVPKAQFDAVLAALLKAPPMPMAGIEPKRPKAKPAKKR